MAQGIQFKTVNTVRPRRNKFDHSHERRLTCDMFQLLPILVKEALPGDVFQIGLENIIRMNPLVAPVMHEVNCYAHYYFVPNRILWDDWEKFWTGGKDGKFTANLPLFTLSSVDPVVAPADLSTRLGVGSLFDHLYSYVRTNGTFDHSPLLFPLMAYNKIWNEYYRDQNIIDEVPLNSYPGNGVRFRAFEKDYFTSSLPWQQRGQAPAIPLSGVLPLQVINPEAPGGAFNIWGQYANNSASVSVIRTPVTGQSGNAPLIVNAANMTTFNVSDLRLAVQLQVFLESMARGGSRYTEALRMIYNAYPRDERLDRPEYIGGVKTPIVISEVLQTSATDQDVTAQGNMAGHGIAADRTYAGSYRSVEHGWVLGLMSIIPRTMYQQGCDRQFLKRSRYDFYAPMFDHLSEQAIYQSELYNNYALDPNDDIDTKVPSIGYIGRWDEYRYTRSTVHGLFRTDFNYWHMGRVFGNAPTLNADLIYPNDAERYALKRGLAVPSEPMFLVTIGNKLHITRPISYRSEPGLIDHRR